MAYRSQHRTAFSAGRLLRTFFSTPFVVFLVVAAPAILPSAPRGEETSTPELLYLTGGFAAGTPFNGPMAIFYDSNVGECYVADTGNHQIVVCDDDGIPIYRFYHRVEIDGRDELGEPRAVAVDRQGRVFVTDALVDYLDILDYRGLRIGRIVPPDDGCGQPARFGALALAPDNTIYASMGCKAPRVAVIDEALTVKRVIELRATDGTPPCVTGLTTDTQGRIFITNPCAEEMVQIFDRDGRYLAGFGRHDSGWENFSFPAGIAVTSHGGIWIVDALRQVACRFDMQGNFLSYIGGKGEEPGAFSYPSAVATAGNGLVFVLERGGNRYQCFRFVDEES